MPIISLCLLFLPIDGVTVKCNHKNFEKDQKAENIQLKDCNKMFFHLKLARVVTLGISVVQYPSESILFGLHFALTPSIF